MVGNLNAKRDWGYAPEYVEAMWKMVQLDKPEDFVIASGEAHSVREFVDLAFKELDMELEWKGKGNKEQGIEKKTRQLRIAVDPKYFRPTEVDYLIGDGAKAKEKLGWEPKVKFKELVKIMVDADWKKVKKRGF